MPRSNIPGHSYHVVTDVANAERRSRTQFDSKSYIAESVEIEGFARLNHREKPDTARRSPPPVVDPDRGRTHVGS
jgi:hypothetical protein